MVHYQVLIGSDPVSVNDASPNAGFLINDSQHDNYFLDWKLSNPSAYKVLVPAGAYDIRISAYAAQAYRVGYVARTDGPPSWDYSTVYGCSAKAWNAAPWKKNNGGTLAKAAEDDWQVRKQDGTAGIIEQYATVTLPRWLYLLPIAVNGTIAMLQISMKIKKKGWEGWNWNLKEAVTVSHLPGPKFIEADNDDPDVPDVPDIPDIPFPPDPFAKPVVELFDDMTVVIQKCTYQGKEVKGPWTLEYIEQIEGWRLKL